MPFSFPALGAAGARYQTRENLVTQVNAALADAVGFPDAAVTITALGMLNVKQYGATGDGVTNDQTAVAAAVAAAYAGGNLLLWPAGDYIVTTLPERFHDVSHGGPGVVHIGPTSWNITPTSDSAWVVNIPTDFDTLQEALEALAHRPAVGTISLNIESGHSPQSGIAVTGGNWGHFVVTSDDAEVAITSFSGKFISAVGGATAPTLGCLVSGPGTSALNAGYDIRERSRGVVLPGCGVKNAWANGCYAYQGSVVLATGTIWSGCAQNGETSSCIHAWGAGSAIFAEDAVATDSGYYGVQASHGGVLSFRNGNASRAYRHGIRASDAGTVDADGAVANNCSADGTGSAVKSHEGSRVNFILGEATGCLGDAALTAIGSGSSLNARGSVITGASGHSIRADDGAIINAIDVDFDSSVRNTDSVVITQVGSIVGQRIERQNLDIDGGSIFFTPSDMGRSYIVADTESDAASDNLDRVRPVTGHQVPEGYLVTIRQSTTGRNITIRDVTTSGAASYGISSSGNNPIAMASSNDVVMLIFTGTHWTVLSSGVVG
jgi:hypothetical protein